MRSTEGERKLCPGYIENVVGKIPTWRGDFSQLSRENGWDRVNFGHNWALAGRKVCELVGFVVAEDEWNGEGMEDAEWGPGF